MSGVIEICNLALAHLGQGPILSIENPTNNIEELCQLQYPLARDSVVSSRLWTFASFRDMSESTLQDDWGINYIHSFKDTWLQAFRVYSSVYASGTNIPVNNWFVEQDAILAPYEKIFVQGVSRVTDSTKFPPLVVAAIASLMASKMCITITENRKLQEDLLLIHERDISAAAARDGGQARSEVLSSTRLINARYRN